jgi:hypothetical protein
MQVDNIGREIRRTAERLRLRWEIEVIPHHSGEKLRLWWFSDARGCPPIGGAGSGVDDDAALVFLRGKK